MEQNLETKPETKVNDDLRELLTRQIELNEKILEKVKYIKKYIVWQKIFSWIKFFLILIPLLVGLFYLPPLLKQLTQTYQSVLNIQNSTNQLNNLPASLNFH